MAVATKENGLVELRESIIALREAVAKLQTDRGKLWEHNVSVPDETGWTFKTFFVYISQRFSDLSLQLQQRFEAQQSGLGTAMVAAEKAVNAALTAAEKAVDKAEQAQALRNESQNEFRQSLSDLSSLMWTIKEGTAALEALRRELDIRVSGVEEKTNVVTKDMANIQGRFAMIGLFWGAFVILGSAILNWVLNHAR